MSKSFSRSTMQPTIRRRHVRSFSFGFIFLSSWQSTQWSSHMAVISHAWMHINATRAHCGQQLSSAIAESPSLADACIALGWWTLTSPVLFTGVHVIGVTQIWLVCFLELPARSRLRDDLLYKLNVFSPPSWNDRLYPCASVKMFLCENSSSQFTTPSTFFSHYNYNIKTDLS